LSSQVVGLIEIDAAAPEIDWGSSSRGTYSGRLCRCGNGYADRIAIGNDGAMELVEAELIAADAQQLTADLQAEFDRLVRCMRAE
jgi:hypothetical protein